MLVRFCTILGLALCLTSLPSPAPGQAGGTDPASFLPDDCQFIAVVNVQTYLTSKAYQDITKAAKGLGLPESADSTALSDKLGLEQADVVQIVMGANFKKLEKAKTEAGSPLVMVVRTKGPVTAEQIVKRAKDQGFTPAKLGNAMIYDGKELSFLVAEKQTVIYGPKTDVRAIVERQAPAKLSACMQAALKDVAGAKGGAVAVALKDLLDDPTIKAILPQLGPQIGQIVGDMEHLAVQVNVGDDIDTSLALLMKNAKSADEARKLAEGFMALAKLGGGKDMPKEVMEVIDAIKLSSDGSRVKGSVAVKTPTVIKLMKDGAKKSNP